MRRRYNLVWVLELDRERFTKTLRICKFVHLPLNDTSVSFLGSLSLIHLHEFGDFLLLKVELMYLVKQRAALPGN
jgi:hypothetical protein